MKLPKGWTLAGVITVLGLAIAVAAWLVPDPFGIGARTPEEPPTPSASTLSPSQSATTNSTTPPVAEPIDPPSTSGSTSKEFDITLQLKDVYDLDTRRKTTVASPSTELSGPPTITGS
jgi:hypothetical protein